MGTRKLSVKNKLLRLGEYTGRVCSGRAVRASGVMHRHALAENACATQGSGGGSGGRCKASTSAAAATAAEANGDAAERHARGCWRESACAI